MPGKKYNIGWDAISASKEQLLEFVTIDENGCWIWTGPLFTQKGYGRIPRQHGTQAAHVVIYELLIGPVPEGFQLDHKCHDPKACSGGNIVCMHRRCVNPQHLSPVTGKMNCDSERRVLNNAGLVAYHASKTHCKWGHQFTKENTGSQMIGRCRVRVCRVCARARSKRWKEKKYGQAEQTGIGA